MRSCSSGWASVIEAITTAGTPTTDCVERAGTADIADSRFESDSDPAQSVFRDLAVPDCRQIVGSPAGNPVLAHERLGRFEHHLAAKDQGLGENDIETEVSLATWSAESWAGPDP